MTEHQPQLALRRPPGSGNLRRQRYQQPAENERAWASVMERGRCAVSSLDPDEWFPASVKPAMARREAAAAIAVCLACPVQAECLAVSLAHWKIGQHGIWGGLVPAERAVLRQVIFRDGQSVTARPGTSPPGRLGR